MLIGAMNNPYINPVEEARFIGESGFDYIDFTVEKPEASPERVVKLAEEVKAALSSFNMKVVGHTPWYFEIGHPYEDVRKVYLQELFKGLKVLMDLGAYKVTIHPLAVIPGVYKRKPYKERLLDWLIESLKTLASKCGENGVMLLVENLDGGSLWTMDEYDRMVVEAGAAFHLDVAHANLNVEANRAGKFIERFTSKGLLKHVHVSDNVGGDALTGWDLHLPLGAGRINFNEVFKELRHFGYDETVTLEVFSQDRDYLKISREKVKKMLL